MHIFVYFGVSIALWLIHLSLATANGKVESPDLLYCVWFTNQIASTLSIGIGCLNLFLFRHRWLFLEKIIIIDRDLIRNFNIHIPYKIMVLMSNITTFCLIFKTLIVTMFVIYFLFELIEFHLHVMSVSLSVFIIVASRLAVTTEFTVNVRTINERNRYLNLILQQLLFDEPIDNNDKCIFIDPKYGLASDELSRMYRSSRPIESKSWMNIWRTKQSQFLVRKPEKRPKSRKNNLKIFPNRAKSESATVKKLLKWYRLSDFGNLHKT